jgi:hypothetical protein
MNLVRLNAVGQVVGGRGGKPTLAQAGGKDAQKPVFRLLRGTLLAKGDLCGASALLT